MCIRDRFDITEYADVLDAGFEAAKVGVIPPGYDCVVLGDIERTRLDAVSYTHLGKCMHILQNQRNQPLELEWNF